MKFTASPFYLFSRKNREWSQKQIYMTSKQKWAFIGILLIAIFFRFYQIKAMPGGLFPDEAANGIDVIAMQRGNIQPFYEGNNGRIAIFLYAVGQCRGIWQRAVAASYRICICGINFCSRLFLGYARIVLDLLRRNKRSR